MPLLGNVVFQKFPTITQDLSKRSIATSGESVSTYPHRLKAEAFSNAVDVVERLRDLTDQVPNARHLHDLHTFSSVTSPELLDPAEVEGEFRQRDGDDEVIDAGLRLSSTTI